MRLGKSACCVRGFSINLPHSGRDSPVPCGGRAARLLETLIRNRCFLAGSRLLQAPWLHGRRGVGWGWGVGNGGENPSSLPGAISKENELRPLPSEDVDSGQRHDTFEVCLA